jgi:hypothetical protein
MIIEVTVADGNSITIPFASGGTYAGSVNFGDGTVNTFSAFNSAGLTHVYVNGGVYLVTITGTFPKFAVANGAFKTYLSDIKQFGSNRFAKVNFYGCLLLIDVTSSDAPSLLAACDLTELMRDCSNMLTFNNLDYWDVTEVTNFTNSYRNCSCSLEVASWNTGNVTIMSGMFNGFSGSADVTAWDVSAVVSMLAAFANMTGTLNITNWVTGVIASAANFAEACTTDIGDVSGINVTNCTSFFRAFRNATGFNSSLATWDIRNATTMIAMLQNSGISTANWNASLIAWDGLVNPPLNINITSKAVATGAGITAKNNLIATWGWTITEGV